MAQKLVGILLNAAVHRGVPRQKTGQESLLNYEEAAAAYGMTPVFLRLADIDTDSGFCAAYIHGPQGYRRTILPTPSVIHNRAIYSTDSSGMKRLLRHVPRVFNNNNRYGKDEIHGLLAQNEELRRYLPETAKGLTGLAAMMNRYPDLILKPCRGSIGNGVMRLIRVRTSSWRWNLTYLPRGARRWTTLPVDQDALPRALRTRLSNVPYLVQERIPLAEMNGRPFDLRVTVQRGWGGEWQVTGLFAKLAAPGGFVSNIARGGEALSSAYVLDTAFSSRDAAILRMSLEALSLAVARSLGQRLPGLADIGLDIGLTRDGRLFFIEANGRDQRYGFRKAGLQEIWKNSYRKPMGYARFLMEEAGPG
ncbi:YheC/YheD family protein [Paenibacillus albidus]|uniref:YheC/YheD family endospore coat-associated protein n=1 Tax=Paenibacillus albidus TaxID=2041023 RepID=UPI001BEC214D|nr:YheC/YheD family protein [Paenibacillus albidus]MBT2291999.1 YheC/YheD family protein [Paenibacillus albidus]